MPDQLLIAFALLCLLFIVEYVLGLLPGNPFKSLKINGNVLKFQRSVLSRQYKIQKASIQKAIVTPGHISLILDDNYENRVLNLNFARQYTHELFQFLQHSLTSTSFEYLDSQAAARPQKPAISLVK